jgi:hypothetical protein
VTHDLIRLSKHRIERDMPMIVLDLWPNDRVVFSHKRKRAAIRYLGTGEFELRGPRGRLVGVFTRPVPKDPLHV